MADPHGGFLLLTALGAVIAMIVAIARYKINPFIVLFVLSLALAAVAGMPVLSIVKSFEPFPFKRIYGAWWDATVSEDGHSAVKRSEARYLQALARPG